MGSFSRRRRYLALRGGQILCNSVNSFAPDESSLHIPVRAAENKVFVVAANKIGPLAPAELLDELSAVTNIPKQFLCGAGESQIVDPEGTVLAIASPDQEEVVFADIDPAQADHKLRPDGSGLFHLRRPGLYSPIAQDPDTQPPAPAKTIQRGIGGNDSPAGARFGASRPGSRTGGASRKRGRRADRLAGTVLL